MKNDHVSTIGSVSSLASTEPAPHTGLAGWFRSVRFVAPARYGRLESSLRVAEIEIDKRIDPNTTGSVMAPPPDAVVPPLSWKDAAVSLLTDARRALTRGDIDQGWRLLHAARRMEIFGLQTSELSAFAAMLRAECDKLSSWRQQAVRTIVGTIEAPRAASPADLAQAALIRDEHYNNQGYKDRLVRSQILLLAALLAAVMAGILGLAFRGQLPTAPDTPPSGFLMLAAVTLFGALGGTVSAMIRASGSMTSGARIPEITSANRVTFMRILMGAASALIVQLALQSQMTWIFDAELAGRLASLNPQTAYVVAFAAGFSERLVLRAVEYVAGK
jgi:hypothetical protein